MRKLLFHRPLIDDSDVEAVKRCLLSGWLTTGPVAARFETAFARLVGARHAVAVNSCTAALHLALLSMDIGPGDEVVTSPITFVSTAHAIHHTGATPVFADVRESDLTIDPEDVARKITPRTRAVLPVHFAGFACDMGEISRIASRDGLKVVLDAAHAVETTERGRRSAESSDVSCYSFYATKNMTTGEGGMLTTDDRRVAEKARLLRLHGITRDAWSRHGASGFRHWDSVAAGWKYNMPDIQAALGLSQMRKIPRWMRRRREISSAYEHAFRSLAGVRTLCAAPGTSPALHLFVVVIDPLAIGRSRDAVMRRMQQRGVGVGVHFRPAHLTEFYRARYGFSQGACPVAEVAGERVMSLPLYPSMTDAELSRIIDTFAWAVRPARRRGLRSKKE